MDLNDAALFVKVVRAGSFAEAGRLSGMPASTVSRRVLSLEAALGARLMQRTTRRLVLTDAGRRFFAESSDLVDALLRTASRLSDDSQDVSGRIRVAAPADFFEWFPAQAVAGFTKSNPRVQLEFELSDARVDLLGEHIDVAFRSADRDQSLIARNLGTTFSSLMASPVYLAERGMPASPRDLGAHHCITSPARGGPRATWRLTNAERAAVSVQVDGPFQASTVSAQLAGALAGLGIGLLPVTLTTPYATAGTLREVLPDFRSDMFGVHCVYHSRRQLPRAIAAFIDFAAATVRELGLMQVKPGPRTSRSLKSDK